MKSKNINDPQFLQLWNRIDLDGNGYLDRNEFEQFMRSYYARHRWEVSQSAMDDAFRLLDKNGDNTIDKSELYPVIQKNIVAEQFTTSAKRSDAMLKLALVEQKQNNKSHHETDSKQETNNNV